MFSIVCAPAARGKSLIKISHESLLALLTCPELIVGWPGVLVSFFKASRRINRSQPPLQSLWIPLSHTTQELPVFPSLVPSTRSLFPNRGESLSKRAATACCGLSLPRLRPARRFLMPPDQRVSKFSSSILEGQLSMAISGTSLGLRKSRPWGKD